MRRTLRCLPLCCAWVLALLLGTVVADDSGMKTIVDFAPDGGVDLTDARDASAELVTDADGRTWLEMHTGHEQRWPGLTLHAPERGWDFSRHYEIAMDVENIGDTAVRVHLRLDTTTQDGSEQTLTEVVQPGERTTLRTPIVRRLPESFEDKLFAMRGYPDGLRKGQGLQDSSHITRLWLFVANPKTDHVFRVDDIRLEGAAPKGTLPPEFDEAFFPMIDRFGQYKHKEWPGKIHSVEGLQAAHQRELADLATNPVPSDRNKWGGWAEGPKLEATGRFRTEKVNGRWWLVDPDGRLFWSHGVDCVGTWSSTTPITDREHYFEALPDTDSPMAEFHGKASWAPHNYYENKGVYRTYCFDGQNLKLKHGDDWRAVHADMVHRRLPSWGMNTIANWSDSNIFNLNRTPYTVTIGFQSPKIEGSEGYWGKFPDPFDPAMAEAVRQRVAHERGGSADDPWCIGYFADNELAWRDDVTLAVSTLSSPAGQPAKQAFIKRLREKYGAIARLNKAWNTDHASWEALAECTMPPEQGGDALADMKDFYRVLSEQYFRTVRDALQEAAPDVLYLGCRFSNDNETAVRAAAKYCDVVSFNRYRYSVADFTLPEGVDCPVVIGEFHFGALDRGMFHTGLRATANQQERAKAYGSYVRGALENEWIVGTHWFQYRDQATTGRGDGENYQIGFVDVCDTPNPEIIDASRRVGRDMYRLRYGQ